MKVGIDRAKFKLLLIENNKTMKDFCLENEIDYAYLNNLVSPKANERGHSAGPQIRTKLLDALGVRFEQLFKIYGNQA